MSRTQTALLVITFILLIIGLWPIALLTTGGIIAIAINNREIKRKNEKQELQQLKEKVAKLEREAYIDSLINKKEE